jgi:hypothetical protein
MELLFGDSSGTFIGLDFEEKEIKLFDGQYLKFTHQLKNKNLGLAYVFGGLYPDGYHLINEFIDLIDIIILDKQIKKSELNRLTEDGFSKENLKTLKQRYKNLIFYNDLDAEIKHLNLYGHKNGKEFDGFILDNGCFTGLDKGKIILTSAIKLEGEIGGVNNQQLISLLLPLTYQQIMNKCQEHQFIGICNSESFWQQYSQKKSYRKLRGKTWKETAEYEEIHKPSFGGKYDKKGVFIYRTAYEISDDILLTSREKEMLTNQLEEDLNAIPEIKKSKDLIFKLKDLFEIHFNIADIGEERIREIENEIDQILTENIYQLKRGTNLHTIAFEPLV